MTQVINFEDYTPAERNDGVSWTEVRIEEAVSLEGSWSLIDTQALTPDPDPTNPEPRDITTHEASDDVGLWYRLIFADINGATSLPTDPIQNAVIASWMPSLQQVADLMPSRTRDKYGNELGKFNDDTRPTDAQVMRLIPDITGRIMDIIGGDVPEQVWEDASFVTAERVAMQIELDYFAEQVNSSRSPYNQLKAQYDEDISKLSKQVQILLEGGELTPISTEPSNLARGAFPSQSLYPGYGLRTRW